MAQGCECSPDNTKYCCAAQCPRRKVLRRIEDRNEGWPMNTNPNDTPWDAGQMHRDIGLLLAALETMTEATGEDLDPDDGAIVRLIQKSHNERTTMETSQDG